MTDQFYYWKMYQSGCADMKLAHTALQGKSTSFLDVEELYMQGEAKCHYAVSALLELAEPGALERATHHRDGRPIGGEYKQYRCVTCETMYPVIDEEIRCNRMVINRCPYCTKREPVTGDEFPITAEIYGWKSVYSKQSGWSFHKPIPGGVRRCWKIRDGWQVADLIDGTFCNHAKGPFDKALTFKEAISLH